MMGAVDWLKVPRRGDLGRVLPEGIEDKMCGTLAALMLRAGKLASASARGSLTQDFEESADAIAALREETHPFARLRREERATACLNVAAERVGKEEMRARGYCDCEFADGPRRIQTVKCHRCGIALR